MAIQYPKAFDPTVLTTSAATIYTVPDSNVLRGGVVRFTNYSAGNVTVTAYAIPSAGAAADGNAFVKERGIPAKGYIDVAVPVMEAGDFLQALASAGTSVNIQFMQGLLQA